jgi:hypothetical protein
VSKPKRSKAVLRITTIEGKRHASNLSPKTYAKKRTDLISKNSRVGKSRYARLRRRFDAKDIKQVKAGGQARGGSDALPARPGKGTPMKNVTVYRTDDGIEEFHHVHDALLHGTGALVVVYDEGSGRVFAPGQWSCYEQEQTEGDPADAADAGEQSSNA